jgi:transposase
MVSVASVVKWSQRQRVVGSPAALKMGGRRPYLVARERDWVLARIAEKPDLTLRALLRELADRSKKSLRASEQDRPDIARRRERWKARQARIDPRRLVFIDETWAKTNMTRAHGRCARGQRLVAKAPFGKWRTLTFLAALRCDGLTAPCVIDGPINGASFRAYVEQVLAPILAPDDIVVMDNLGSHKGRAIRAAIRAAKAKLFFLPAYSPDLNPIEQAFAKMKTLLRKADARTIEQTWRTIGALLDCFTPTECANYFKKRRICFSLNRSRFSRLRTQGGARFDGAPMKRFTEPRSLERSVRRVSSSVRSRSHSSVNHNGDDVVTLVHANDADCLRFQNPSIESQVEPRLGCCV